MMERLDDDLFAALTEAAALLGPPTERERRAAEAARDFLGVTRNYELAELAFDSLLDEAVAVRGPALAAARELEFDAPEMTVRVELSADLLTCRIDPAGPTQVMLVTSSGTSHPLRGVGSGLFELADPPSGAARLELRSATTTLATSWIHL